MGRKTKEKPKTIFHSLAGIFYPMSHNGHHPHLLKGKTLMVMSFVAVFLLGVSVARFHFLHGTVLGEQVVSSVLIDLTNQTRIQYNQSPLEKSDKLELASEMKANDMAEYHYFSHNSPTGVTPWHWIEAAGYNFMYAGENLAIDFTQSKDVEDAWLKSPTHRANILNKHFTQIGVSTKEGTFNGHNTIYVVQMFGTPAPGEAAEESDSTASDTLAMVAETKNSQTNSSSELVATNTKEDGQVQGQNAAGEVLGTEKTKLLTSSTDSATTSTTTVITSSQAEANNYQVLSEDENSIVVANQPAINTAGTSALTVNPDLQASSVVQYSNFWQKFIYKFWFGLNSVYKVVVILITISLIFLLFAEFKRHHWLHLLYGTSTILFLFLLLYLNQGLW